MKQIISIFLLMVASILSGQKMVVKTIENSTASFIQIDAKNCYSVDIKTVDSPEITVEGIIEGEYLHDLLISLKQEGVTALVSTGFHSNYDVPNDKLSTHKVISIALRITVPTYLNVLVYGTSSHVRATGDYANLKITLFDGECILDKVGENVNVTTQSGNIEVFTTKAQINAATKYGKINRAEVPTGDNHIILNSITGNIGIRKTE